MAIHCYHLAIQHKMLSSSVAWHHPHQIQTTVKLALSITIIDKSVDQYMKFNIDF
jgi:hypothetical protein